MSRPFVIAVIMLLALLAEAAPDSRLATSLKEDFYRDMAAREDIDPDLRIIWFDSLINMAGPDKVDIEIRKADLLRSSGHPEKALALTEAILASNRRLPLHQRLPLLFIQSSALGETFDLFRSLSGFERIIGSPKPDSLRYWDLKAALSIFTIYSDINDVTMARKWLDRARSMAASYPLEKRFRQDAEARIHGSAAALLINDNLLDSAYNEVRAVRELALDDDTRIWALLQIAQIYMNKGMPEASEKYLQEALQISGDKESGMKRSARHMLAIVRLRRKDYEGAMDAIWSSRHSSQKSGTLSNTRAFYIIRGQALAGLGYLAPAYNSLDSALVAGDSIIANMKRMQAKTAAQNIEISARAKRAADNVTRLRGWLVALAAALAAAAVALSVSVAANRRLRSRLDRSLRTVREARDKINSTNLRREEQLRKEEDMSRRHTSLMLRLANLETLLDSFKRNLAADSFDKKTRDGFMRQLRELDGKEKMWDIFWIQFEMTNKNFMTLLDQRHPDLTKTEKRLCAFMLLDLSTKDIAALTGRSPRTIDVTKYNIRKKLALTVPTEKYLRDLAAES